MTKPALSVAVRGKGRHYRDPDTGELLPSVTNILGILDKPALTWWYVKGALSAAWESREALRHMPDADTAYNAFKSAAHKKRDKAADLGTDIHNVCEALAGDRKLPSYSATAKPYVDQFLRFVSEHDVEFLAVERTVIHPDVGYGGTYDALVRMHGELCLLDFKTGSGVYPEAALQLSALANAPYYIDERGRYEHEQIEAAGVVHLQPDDYSVIPVHNMPANFQAFTGLRAAWEFVKGGGAETALGPPVQPAKIVAEIAAGP